MLKGLGDCEHCKSYTLTSKTEKERKQIKQKTHQLFTCDFPSCNKVFKSISSMNRHKQANKHTARDMARLNLKRPRQSKNSKPKKKKGINQVIRQEAATAENHFDDEDPCEFPHCKISEKPYDRENDDDEGIECIQRDEINGCKKWFHQFCVDLDPALITQNFQYIQYAMNAMTNKT